MRLRLVGYRLRALRIAGRRLLQLARVALRSQSHDDRHTYTPRFGWCLFEQAAGVRSSRVTPPHRRRQSLPAPRAFRVGTPRRRICCNCVLFRNSERLYGQAEGAERPPFSVRHQPYLGRSRREKTRSKLNMSDQQEAGPKSARAADGNEQNDAKRQAALKGALAQIEKQYGKGAVMRMGDPGARVAVDAIPTGALSLDIALGIGGVPRGRIVEIFGPESSGKTTLVYHILAEAQKLGGVCAFIDAEHAMDPIYAQQIGADIDELLVSQPDYGEQALEIADMLIRSSAVDLVAIDSVAALTPRAELEGQMGDQSVGVQARMMSQAMRKLAGNLNRTQTLCLFTNQIREKVGVMFGSPETQPGGRALKFYSSQRLDIRRIETLKDGTEAVGNRVRVKVVKNKVAAPFRIAEFDIEFGKGISASGCLLDLGLEHNIVSKSGSFFSYGNERLGQGRGNAKSHLDANPALAKEIEDKIYAGLA